MTFDEYIKAPGLSHSMMKAMHPTPFHLQIYLRKKREPTPDQIIGTLAHSLILEPDKPLPKLSIQPAKYYSEAASVAKDWNNNAKVCRAWVAEQEQAGFIVVTAKEYETIHGIANSVASFGLTRQLLEEGESEVCIFEEWPGPISAVAGIVMGKARLDFVTPGNTLVDIKTTRDASEDSFRWDIINHRYHSQAAWYLDLWNANFERERKECFVIVAVEKTPPYLVACYLLDRDMIEAGRLLNSDDATTYAQCQHTGNWPAYPETYVTMTMPQRRL